MAYFSVCYTGAKSLTARQWLGLLYESTKTGLATGLLSGVVIYGVATAPLLKDEDICRGANAEAEALNCTTPYTQPFRVGMGCPISAMIQNCVPEELAKAAESALSNAGEVYFTRSREEDFGWGVFTGVIVGTVASACQRLHAAGQEHERRKNQELLGNYDRL